MEAIPTIEGLETVPQPDLLEVFADKEFSMFGVTGTFRELADMCPVDLNDPRVTLEAKNEVIIKAANEAGIEIEPEHEELFARVIEGVGLERKFTVAAPKPPAMEDNSVRTPKEESAATHKKLQEKRAREPEPVVVPVANNRTEAIKLPIEKATATPDKLPHIDMPKPSTAERLTESLILPKPVVSDTYDIRLQDHLLAMDEVTEHAGEVRAAVAEAPLDTQSQPIESEAGNAPRVAAVDAPAFDIDDLLAQIEAAALPAPIETDMLFISTQAEHLPLAPLAYIENEGEVELPALPIRDAEAAEVPAAAIDWGDELNREPLEVYEDFAEALHNFAELPAAASIAAGDETLFVDPQLDNDENTHEIAEAPPILVMVSERLAELRSYEKELAAPILKNIVGAVHGIQLLEIQEADLEAVAAVGTRLEELCATLFETIGVPYTEQDVAQFIRIMLHPEFQPPQLAESEELDLEHMGTREVKRHFAQLLGGLADAEDQLQRWKLLGTLALLRMSASKQNKLVLAA